jgi:hypothetical protein
VPTFKNNNGRKIIGPDDAKSGRRDRVGEAEDQLRGQRVSKEQYARAMDNAIKAEARDEASEEMERIRPGRIYEPRCHVCNHPHRDWIEAMLVRGATYKGIQDRVPPAKGYEKLDRRSVSNHHKNHMDLQDAALLALIEEEAKLQGLNREEGVRDILSKRAVLEVAVRKGYEDILAGVTTVEPRDLVQITKLLAEMDAQALQTGLDEARQQVQMFIDAIKSVCNTLENGSDIQQMIVEEVRKMRKRQGVHTDIETVMVPQIPEAIVVHDDIDLELQRDRERKGLEG